MKLNNFLSETPIVKPKRVTFNLENEAKDTQYQKEIAELETKLEHYASLEESFEQLKKSTSKLRESHADSNVMLSKAEEKASILNLDLNQAQEKIDLIPEFEETVKGLKGTLSDKSNELDNMQKVAYQQSSDLAALRKQLEGLTDENKQLMEQTETSVSHSISAENELESIKATFSVLEANMHIFGQENAKFRRELNELRDTSAFWETEASEASIRIAQQEDLEGRLRTWISNCEVSISRSEAKSGGATKDNESLTHTVTEMGGTINELMQELSYVNSLNTEYRKEIAKPRYASVGAIASKEGFAMPLAKENIRIKNLGNSSPTLLKFREKESI